MEKSQYEKEKDYFIDLWNKKADLTHLKSVLEDTDIKNIINSPRQLEQITSIEKLLQILSFRSEANIQTLYRIVSSAIRPFSNDLWLISFRDHISKCVFNNRYGDISSFSKPHKVHYGVNYIPLRNSECTKFSPESSPVLSEYEKLQPIHIGK